MIKTYIRYGLVGVLFFAATLVQSSVVPFFSIKGAVPQLLFVLFFLALFFKHSPAVPLGILLVAVAGFFMDVISPFPFGISMGALGLVYAFYLVINTFIERGQGRYLVFEYIGLFCLCFAIFYGALYLLAVTFTPAYAPSKIYWGHLAYSIPFALAFFYIYAKFFHSKENEKQLKLL